jgi:hypothetical protein
MSCPSNAVSQHVEQTAAHTYKKAKMAHVALEHGKTLMVGLSIYEGSSEGECPTSQVSNRLT